MHALRGDVADAWRRLCTAVAHRAHPTWAHPQRHTEIESGPKGHAPRSCVGACGMALVVFSRCFVCVHVGWRFGRACSLVALYIIIKRY